MNRAFPDIIAKIFHENEKLAEILQMPSWVSNQNLVLKTYSRPMGGTKISKFYKVSVENIIDTNHIKIIHVTYEILI
jgi:hypothetical protein